MRNFAGKPEVRIVRSFVDHSILLYGIPRIIIGENLTFLGEEDLLRSRGVQLEVIQDAECVEMMRDFVEAQPKLWNEDIGE